MLGNPWSTGCGTTRSGLPFFNVYLLEFKRISWNEWFWRDGTCSIFVLTKKTCQPSWWAALSEDWRLVGSKERSSLSFCYCHWNHMLLQQTMDVGWGRIEFMVCTQSERRKSHVMSTLIPGNSWRLQYLVIFGVYMYMYMILKIQTYMKRYSS